MNNEEIKAQPIRIMPAYLWKEQRAWKLVEYYQQCEAEKWPFPEHLKDEYNSLLAEIALEREERLTGKKQIFKGWICVTDIAEIFLTESEVIGYNEKWIDEDYNPNGTRICFYSKDYKYWTIAVWNNEQDCYSTRVTTNIYGDMYPIEEPPTHILPITKKR